jgi:uncharacterized repeat protein (TIGR01451 family)
MQHPLRRSPLLVAVCLFAALLLAPAANAASVPAQVVDGNPKCPSGYESITKFDPGPGGTATQAGVTVTRTGSGTFDWTSTVAVDLVIVKGGPNANLYAYPLDTFGDTNLSTPINPNNGQPYGISHIEFCTDGEEEPPPVPDIDLEKSASVTQAPAGSAVDYTFTVTNTGEVSWPEAEVVLTDDKCDDGTLELVTNDPDKVFGPGEIWIYTCTATIPDDATGSFVNVAEVCVPVGDEDELCDEDTTTVTIPPPPTPNPDIDLVKVAGVSQAPAGSTVEYTFTVTNTGDVTFNDEDVVLTDSKCNAGTLVRTQGDDQLAPDEVWTYKCAATIPAGTTGSFVNVAEVCVPQPGEDDLCDDDTTTVTVPPPGQLTPGIDLEKAASATSAAAGSSVTYTFTVKNTGQVPFAQAEVDLTDAKCNAGTLVRNTGDDVLGPNEVWSYSCVATIPAGTTGSFVNTAEVCVPNPGATPPELCDTDTVTVTVPPVTPPVTPPVVTPPGGGQLPEEVVSGRARLRGPSGCVKQAFRARVSGRQIRSVAFFVDGKLVKQINKRKSVYKVKIRPNKYGFGRHRVIARVRFTTESGTSARRLPLTFRRCGRGAVAPRFTG